MALYAMIVRQVLKATANERFHVERCPSYIPLSFSDMTPLIKTFTPIPNSNELVPFFGTLKKKVMTVEKKLLLQKKDQKCMW